VTTKGGKVLLHCFSGCSQPDVIAALCDRGLWGAAIRTYTKGGQPRRKQIPSGHAMCPKCRARMWPPDEDAPGAWWCDDCAKFVLKRDALIEYYEYPPIPADLEIPS